MQMRSTQLIAESMERAAQQPAIRERSSKSDDWLSPPKKFLGTGADAAEPWLLEFKTFTRIKCLDDARTVACLKQNVSPEVNVAIKNLGIDAQGKPEVIYKMMVERWPVDEAKKRARQDFAVAKQGNFSLQTFLDYLVEKRMAGWTTEHIESQEAIQAITERLVRGADTEETQRELHRRTVDLAPGYTLGQLRGAVTLARATIKGYADVSRHVKTTSGALQHPRRDGVHQVEMAPTSVDHQMEVDGINYLPSKERPCNKCGSPSHWARECTSQAVARQAPNANGPWNGPSSATSGGTSSQKTSCPMSCVERLEEVLHRHIPPDFIRRFQRMEGNFLRDQAYAEGSADTRSVNPPPNQLCLAAPGPEPYGRDGYTTPAPWQASSRQAQPSSHAPLGSTQGVSQPQATGYHQPRQSQPPVNRQVPQQGNNNHNRGAPSHNVPARQGPTNHQQNRGSFPVQPTVNMIQAEVSVPPVFTDSTETLLEELPAAGSWVADMNQVTSADVFNPNRPSNEEAGRDDNPGAEHDLGNLN